MDNLKLGYGGTQDEMKRLVSDAAKLTDVQKELGISVDENSLSYSNVVNAIHVVQTEMGITGTTADEAATTIEGSVNTAKAAWENLLTGLPDKQANITDLLNDLVASVGTVAKNILPVIEQTVKSMIEVFTNNLPEFASKGVELIEKLANGIADGIPKVLEALPKVIASAIEFLAKNFPKFVQKGGEIIVKLANGIIQAIPKMVAQLPKIITAIVNFIVKSLPQIIKTGIEITVKIGVGLVKAIPQLVRNIPQIVKAIVSGFTHAASSFINIGKNIVTGVWNGIKSMASWVKRKVSGFFNGIIDTTMRVLKEHSPSKVYEKIGANTTFGYINGLDKSYGKLKSKVVSQINNLKDNVVIPGVSKINKELAFEAKRMVDSMHNMQTMSGHNSFPTMSHTSRPGRVAVAKKGVKYAINPHPRKDEYELPPVSIHTTKPAVNRHPKRDEYFLPPVSNKTTKPSINRHPDPTTEAVVSDSAPGQKITIVLKPTLDGKVIGESTYNYIQNKNRRLGYA